MRKKVRTFAIAAVLSILPLGIGANSASAWGGEGYECTTLSSGDLCIRMHKTTDSAGFVATNVEVQYSKYSGSAISLKGGIGMPNTTKWASSYKSLTAGHTYSWTYKVSLQAIGCENLTGIIQVTGQGQFATPPQSDCQWD
jgi:hypothetical protein